MSKTLTTLLLIVIFNTSFGQYEDLMKDSFKPYLIENQKIVGANTASLNRDSSETTVDTIYYWLIILDTTAGVTVKKKNNGLTYNFLYGIKGYGLWVKSNPNFGGHWDLFDEKFRLLRNQPIIITQIIELTQ